jgi:hypothetical protein
LEIAEAPFPERGVGFFIIPNEEGIMKRFWLIVLALAILPGCTKTVWIHPEKTSNQYGPDRWDCEQELAARQTSSIRIFGKMAWGSSSKPDDDDIDRCLVFKHGWTKKEVPK